MSYDRAEKIKITAAQGFELAAMKAMFKALDTRLLSVSHVKPYGFSVIVSLDDDGKTRHLSMQKHDKKLVLLETKLAIIRKVLKITNDDIERGEFWDTGDITFFDERAV